MEISSMFITRLVNSKLESSKTDYVEVVGYLPLREPRIENE